MKLQLHDSEEGNTLCGTVEVDYDYQAEQWVQDTRDDPHQIVRWVLEDDSGVRCVWERPEGSQELPSITQRSSRFRGEWEKGASEVAI